MNVFKKSVLHAHRRKLDTKTFILLYTKIVQHFEHSQSCNNNKDQNEFYKVVDGNSMNRI